MRNALIILLFAAAAGLAGLCVHQRNQIVTLQTRLASAESQLRAAQDQLKEMSDADRKISYAEKKVKLYQDTLAETSAVAVRQSEEVSQLQQFLAVAKTNTDTSKALSGLFKDPAMKEMVKAQQRAYIGPVVDKSYTAFFQQMNLTPEQTAHMKSLLEKKMLVAAELGMSGLDSNMDAAKRAELGQQIKSQTDVYDAQLKEFLGEDNYRTFQSYEQSVPDRLAVGQLREQLAGSDASISGLQERQLVQLMQEERSAFKWTANYGRREPGSASAALPNEEQLNTYAEEAARLDRQILARARPILSPAQMAAFERFQLNQSQMQISLMKLAGKMFAPPSQ